MTATTPREIEEFMTLVRAARTLLAEGKAVNLEGLETRTERLCQSLAGVSANSGRQALKKTMADLVDELNKLESDIKGQHEILARQLGALSDRQRATTAYGGQAPKK